MTNRPDANIKNNNADVYQIMRPHYYVNIGLKSDAVFPRRNTGVFFKVPREIVLIFRSHAL